LDKYSPKDEEKEEEYRVDVLEDRTLISMVEVEPARACERSRDFKKNEGGSDGHSEVLLPKSNVVVTESDDVMDEHLFVNGFFYTNIQADENSVDD